MVKTSKKTISDVDLVLMLFEPYGEFNDAELDIIENIKSSKLPRLRVINKKDTIKSKSDGLVKWKNKDPMAIVNLIDNFIQENWK